MNEKLSSYVSKSSKKNKLLSLALLALLGACNNTEENSTENKKNIKSNTKAMQYANNNEGYVTQDGKVMHYDRVGHGIYDTTVLEGTKIENFVPLSPYYGKDTSTGDVFGGGTKMEGVEDDSFNALNQYYGNDTKHKSIYFLNDSIPGVDYETFKILSQKSFTDDDAQDKNHKYHNGEKSDDTP